MEHSIDNGTLTVTLGKRIDSNNYAEFERELFEICGAVSSERIVLDAEKLEYISSAGLRVLMKLVKSRKSVTVINVSGDVYDIFDVTGFTELMKVEKALRKLSAEGCEVIGAGGFGTVYRLTRDQILKVYKSTSTLDDIRRGQELARRAFILGLPTAIPFDIVKVGDKYGSVFELIDAQSASKTVSQDPSRLDELVRQSVDLMKQLHSTEIKEGELSQVKDREKGNVVLLRDYLPEEICDRLYELLDSMPDSKTVTHGDLHFNNILIQNGEMIMIDLDTFAAGDPVFDFAGQFNLYHSFPDFDHDMTPRIVGVPYEMASKIWDLTLRYYLGDDYERLHRQVEFKAEFVGRFLVLCHFVVRRKHLIGSALWDHCINFVCENIQKVDSLTLF